jgi:hypothetical protein
MNRVRYNRAHAKRGIGTCELDNMPNGKLSEREAYPPE